jgi:hypothetical protein
MQGWSWPISFMLLANSLSAASSKCLRGVSGFGSIALGIRTGRLNGIFETAESTLGQAEELTWPQAYGQSVGE